MALNIKKLIRRVGGKILRPVKRKYIESKTKHVVIETDEILLQQNGFNEHVKLGSGGGYNRLDIIVRYLAIECYFGKNSYGFEFYRRMQSKRQYPGYEKIAERQFRELINSYMENGYDSKSEIELDSDLMLIDGSHRMALALYFGWKTISCKVRPYKTNILYDASWFIMIGFTEAEVQLIIDKYEELLKNHTQWLSCILWPPAAPFFEEITHKLDILYEVRNVKDLCFKDETFKRAVRGIYSIDDIEEWKIDKKMEGMQPYPKLVRVMEIKVMEPRFRLKVANNHTISEEGEWIKKMIRDTYKGKIDNYFYDIIVHTGDNYRQSRFITKLMEPHFSLREYFDLIAECPYILIRSESEYLPDDFPDNYPFGKDIDIVCDKDQYEMLVDDTMAFAERYCLPDFTVRYIDERSKIRIRIEQENYLVFLFDITVELEGVNEDFVKEAIRNRVLKENYYVPRMEDELIFRAYEVGTHPEKTKHLEYIKSHIENWDSERAKEALPEMMDILEKI